MSAERYSACHPRNGGGIAFHDASPQITPVELARIRAVLQIDDSLARCVSDPREVALWFRRRKTVAPFGGRTPLALLFRGMTGFEAVAEYLAAWRVTAPRLTDEKEEE
ncbi:MAG: antitoxin Xre/MbcA/ParS toxin-binding domain-containing protein [Steroidobacteraceae bacterium]